MCLHVWKRAELGGEQNSFLWFLQVDWQRMREVYECLCVCVCVMCIRVFESAGPWWERKRDSVYRWKDWLHTVFVSGFQRPCRKSANSSFCLQSCTCSTSGKAKTKPYTWMQKIHTNSFHKNSNTLNLMLSDLGQCNLASVRNTNEAKFKKKKLLNNLNLTKLAISA